MADITILASGSEYDPRADRKIITPIVQGNDATTYSLILYQADESAVIDITGATITGTMLNRDTGGTPTSIAGTLVIVLGTAGTFTWKPSAADTGTAGNFDVQLLFTLADTTVHVSYPATLKIIEQHGASVVPAAALVGVSTTEAALLTLLETITDAATNGQVLTADGADSFTFTGSATAFLPIDSDSVRPDDSATGDGTGTHWQNVSPSNTVYRIDFGTTDELEEDNRAPASAKAVVCLVRLDLSGGLGNASNVYVRPNDSATILVDNRHLHMRQATAVAIQTETITFNFGANQILEFSNAFTPSGATNGSTLSLWVKGYITG